MSQRSRFRTCDRFSVYYGADAVAQLLKFDVVVLEPGHRTKEDIQALKDNDTLVLAYVSVMEVHDEHPLRAFVTESQFLREAMEPHKYITQREYHNRVVDMQSPTWRGHLLRHVGTLITREGYDGIFMDTIGDVEMPNLPNPMQQVEGAHMLVQQIRKWFPDIILIQNNGLEVLCNYTAPYLDAIAWENPPINVPQSKQWVRAVAERLVYLRLKHSLRILMLFEGVRQDKRSDFIRGLSFAQENGFTTYFSPKHYQSFH